MEVVIYSLRTAGGVLMVTIMRSISFALRFSAMIMNRIGRILVSVFDITIVLPLLIERWVLSLRGAAPAVTQDKKSRSAT